MESRHKRFGPHCWSLLLGLSVVFSSVEAMGQAMGSSIGQRVSADVAHYATGGVVLLHYGPDAG